MARAWQIAIVGTFDVENYGDLLFPIIAEAELSRRLGAVTMHRFSYHDRTPPAWPYAVTSLADLPQCSQQLDGLLVGGGFILRFDKVVAHGYGPPSPDIHHPTGYWLTPALLAIEQGIPVIWNAPGMHCNEVPAWAAPLLRLALANSACIRVRDALTQETLARVATDAHISVLPDTAFGLPRLLDPQQPSAEFTRIAAAAGLGDRYLVIHAIAGLEPFLRLIRQYPQQFSDYQLLLLPIGPVLGDHAAVLGDELPRAVQLPSWPAPMLLAELIANAQAVVGHSYHLAITAIALGCPSAVRRVPSSGSTAMSTSARPVWPCAAWPTFSPMKSIGASSRSPSPITTVPSIGSWLSAARIASTAAASAAFSSPRPISFDAAIAAASVTRTISRTRTRSRRLLAGAPDMW